MPSQPIYMDNHATTPLDPEVLDAMMPYLTHEFGNPASKSHAFGWRAETAVDRARAQVAACLDANPNEIIFTSGATESNNTAIKGVAYYYKQKGRHIITSAIEHHAVLHACEFLEKEGFRVTYLQPSSDGLIRLEQIEAAICEDTILVSMMLVNNEIGVLNPINEMGPVIKKHPIFFHCDATQGIGRVPFSVNEAQLDLASISGHKIYGPKGVGALYVRRSPRVSLEPLIVGGGHENGIRSGTLNVPGIVGLGEACRLVMEKQEHENKRLCLLRDTLYRRLTESIPDLRVNGCMAKRVAGNLNIGFIGIDGERLMLMLSGRLAVSAGSACTSSTQQKSHVLCALGLEPNEIGSSVRFGLGRFNTEEEVVRAADLISKCVKELREESPAWQCRSSRVSLKGACGS